MGLLTCDSDDLIDLWKGGEMSRYVLGMQQMASTEDAQRAPSTNSWAFCFSTTSVIIC